MRAILFILLYLLMYEGLGLTIISEWFVDKKKKNNS